MTPRILRLSGLSPDLKKCGPLTQENRISLENGNHAVIQV